MTSSISRLGSAEAAAPALTDLADPALGERLLDRLREHWGPGLALKAVRRAEGGFSNETWFANVSIDGVDETLVIRREALVGPLEPYDIVREAAIVRALKDTAVPVPEVHLVCEDPGVLGSPFIVMERVDGLVPEYRNLPEYPPWADPRNRTAMAREIVRILRLIQEAPAASEPLAGLLAAGPAPAAEVPVVGRVRWILEKLELQLGAGAVPPVLRETAGWLVEHAPPRDRDWVLVHGDYKVGNFIWRGNSVVAVLDWEGAGLGDPFEDLGYACHPLMRARAPELMAMLVPFDELARIHEEEMGRPVELARVHYYVIYALYFHLYSLVSGIVSALNGADLRVALGYAKFHRATHELLSHMKAYEEGSHVL